MAKLTYEEARIKAGYESASEMSRKMGISRASYEQKENYDRQFKDNELMKFCELANIKPDKLYIKGYNY